MLHATGSINVKILPAHNPPSVLHGYMEVQEEFNLQNIKDRAHQPLILMYQSGKVSSLKYFFLN